MKDRYKETEIGVLPEDWEVVKINDIANYVGSGTTPRGGSDVYKTEGITFIRSQNVYPNKLVLDDVVYIDEATNEKMKRTILQDKDVLLNITGASIGRTAVLPSGFGRSNVNQHVCIIRLKEFFLPIYLSQFINSSFGRKQIDSYNGGSSREGLNFKQVRDILVTAPPLPEQHRIAEILSATDAHLEKLETIIVDIQLLKKGIMQSLLTRGIGHTEFKDTEIGQIPKAWGVKQFKDIAEILMGQSPSGDSYNNDSIGIALLNGPTEFGSVHPTPIQWTTKPTKICTVDDILFCVRGSSTGRMNISNGEYCIGRGLAAIRNKNLVSSTAFLYYTLQMNLNMLLNACTGSTFPNINKEGIGGIMVGFPPLSEQRRIAKIISAIDHRKQIYEKEKENFIQLKKGLMEQLLTGKIRTI